MSGTIPPLAPGEAAFYTAQSTASDPGALAPLYRELPADPADPALPARLAGVVRGLLIHRLEGPLFGHAHPEDRLAQDAETRYTDDILRILADRSAAPLTAERPPADRFVGICRDFALLHVSMLRHAGVPARIRVGFADYFGPEGFHGDHVVTEYWDAEHGWRLADPQLGGPWAGGKHLHGAPFDPMDVPRDRFLTAGAAWRRCRSGTDDPETYGLQDPPFTGLWFLTGSNLLDLAALNGSEMLQWDVWGAGTAPGEEVAPEARALHDEVAAVTGGPVTDFGALRALYPDERLRVPATVTSLAPFLGTRQVELR